MKKLCVFLLFVVCVVGPMAIVYSSCESLTEPSKSQCYHRFATAAMVAAVAGSLTSTTTARRGW